MSSPAVEVDPRLRGHVSVLDGVRGLAIGMVLALHFVGNTTPTNALEHLITGLCTFGLYGVDLFFVLSGFLITGILLDAKGRPGYFRNFYMRRALRIFPLYYGVLALLFWVAPQIAALRGPELDVLERDQAWAWLYGVNVLTAIRAEFSLPYIDHFWSLSVEEHFYFVWPLLVWLTPRRLLVRIGLCVAAASVLGRILLAGHAKEIVTYVLTPFRLDALCLGGVLAALARDGRGGLAALGGKLKTITLSAVAVFAASYAFNRVTGVGWLQLHELRASLIMLLLAMVMLAPLVAAETTLTARFFGSAPLRLLGKYSYGLYVFHHFVTYYFVHHATEFVVARWVSSHALAVFLQASVGIAFSFGLAVASYHGFEKRFIGLKRYWPATGESLAKLPVPAAGATEG